MQINPSRNLRLILFLALTLALSGIFYFLIITNTSSDATGGAFTLGLMWSPGIAALVTQLVTTRSLRGLGWKPGRIGFLLLAMVLPLLYCLVTYGLTWITGLGGVPDAELMQRIQARWGGLTSSPMLQIILTVLLTAIMTIPLSLVSALGEEIGWRGLFVPELHKQFSFRSTALISGTVWALWHMPLLFFADYNLPGAPKWYAALMFTTMVIGLSFAFAWLRLRSGSLWPAALLHAAHNVFVQTIFTPLTVQNEVTPYIIDEFGVGLALCSIALAVIFTRLVSQDTGLMYATSTNSR